MILYNHTTLALKHSIILSCILFFASLGWAKNPVYYHLDEEIGLPSTQIYSMVQDDMGFLWFASEEGLYRYNGKEFKHFDNPDKKGISVFNLRLDQKGRVWCTNLFGEFYYVENQQLNFFYDVVNEFQLPESIYEFDFLEDRLLIFGKATEIQVDLLTKESQIKRQPNPNAYQFSKTVKRNDTLYVSRLANNQLFVDFYTNEKFKSHTRLRPILLKNIAEADGKLLLGNMNLYFQEQFPKTDSSLFVFKKYQSYATKTPSFLNGTRVIGSSIFDNDLWYSTGQGLYVCHFDERLDSLELRHHLLPRHSITQTLKDKNDVYWISTLHSGIYVLPNLYLYAHKMKVEAGVPTAIEFGEKNKVVLGTNLGYICIYDTQSEQFDYIKLPSQVKVEKLFYHKHFNQVYISTGENTRSYIYDFATKKMINKTGAKQNIVSAKSLISLTPSQLYYSSFQNEFLLSTDESGFYNRRKIDRNVSKPEKNIEALYDEKNSQLYVGYTEGLKVFEKNNEVFPILLNGQVIIARSLTQSANGDIWVASKKLGLLQIRGREVIRVLTEQDGLLENKILAVKAYENTVWFTTEKGVQFYDMDLRQFSGAITKADGLPNTSILDFQVGEDEIYFITNQGLFSADKNRVIKEPLHLKTLLSQVKVNDKNQGLVNYFSINGNQEKVEFRFTTNQLVDRKSARFQYRLLEKGKEEQNWITLPPSVDNVLFNSLKSGHYRFQVRSQYLNLASNFKEVQFDIHLPFYQRWWFQALILSILLASTILYLKYRIRKKEKDAENQIIEHKKEIEQTYSQLDHLNSHLNPNFVTNTLNSIQQFILLNKNDIAKEYLDKLSRLLSIYNTHKDAETISLENVMNGLESYLEIERLRFGHRFNYTLQLAANIDPVAVFIHPMLILPYVENAVQFGLHAKGAKGWLVVCFSLEEDKLICEIQDDGIGREKAKDLKLTNSISFHSFTTHREELVEYANNHNLSVNIQDIVEDSAIIGTKITLKIPFKNAEVKSWKDLANRSTQIISPE